jgi:glycosyltransferase involved in cell wall biosynthesis
MVSNQSAAQRANVVSSGIKMMLPSNVAPLLCIGLPVYNGEEYLPQALEALTSQDYVRCKIIVSDNGSTDRTPHICQKFADAHPNVVFHRSPENRGAAWNFGRVLELADGPYFAWAACDDLWEPSFFRCCVEALEAEQDAVGAHTQVRLLERHNNAAERIVTHFGTSDLVTWRRFRSVVQDVNSVYAIYGVFRTSILKNSRLFRPTLGSDKVLLAELVLKGRFIVIPQPLFTYRLPLPQPPEDYLNRVLEDLGLKGAGASFDHSWPKILRREYLSVALRHPGATTDRLLSALAVLQWYWIDVVLLYRARTFGVSLLGPDRFASIVARLRRQSWYQRFRGIPRAHLDP